MAALAKHSAVRAIPMVRSDVDIIESNPFVPLFPKPPFISFDRCDCLYIIELVGKIARIMRKQRKNRALFTLGLIVMNQEFLL